MVAEEELGVTPPFGLLDPLGWMDTQPQNFERRRAVERKHGRIAMVAVVGMLVHNAGIEFPGYLSYPGSPLGTPAGIPFSSIPDGFAGLFSLPPFGLVQILLFCGIVETSVWPASEYSGNYGTGYPFGDLSDPEVRAFKLNLELNQGRAAMLGIFAANIQEGIQTQAARGAHRGRRQDPRPRPLLSARSAACDGPSRAAVTRRAGKRRARVGRGPQTAASRPCTRNLGHRGICSPFACVVWVPPLGSAPNVRWPTQRREMRRGRRPVEAKNRPQRIRPGERGRVRSWWG